MKCAREYYEHYRHADNRRRGVNDSRRNRPAPHNMLNSRVKGGYKLCTYILYSIATL